MVFLKSSQHVGHGSTKWIQNAVALKDEDVAEIKIRGVSANVGQ